LQESNQHCCHTGVLSKADSRLAALCDRIATLCNIAQQRQDFDYPTFAAFVDLHAAFDSLSQLALWVLLTRLGIPHKIVRLFRVLYNNSISCVRTGGTHSSWFKIEAGVRQGCVLAPDSFATGMDWLLDRTVESCSIGVAFGQSSFTDLDFADDVSLLAELLELLPILETIASEAASLGFEVHWQKTKVQALGCREDMPLTINSEPGRNGSRGICLPCLSYPLINHL